MSVAISTDIMQVPMAVAVLIVNYRAYRSLERCLASLERVLRSDDEVVVVDQQSDPEELRHAIVECPRALTIARTDNVGFAAGVNLAARLTSAPYLLLLNPDAEVTGPVQSELEAWLDAHPNVGIVGPRVLNTDGSVQPTARRFPGLWSAFAGRSTWLTTKFPDNWMTRRNLVSQHATEPLEVDWVSGACFMTRREVFDSLGGMDESFFLYTEDADYCRRAAASGHGCVYLPHVTVRHSLGACAAFAPAASIRAFHDSAFRYYWKHSGLAGRSVAPFVRAGLMLRAELRVRQALKYPRPLREAAPARPLITTDP